MPVVLSISDVRQEIYRQAGGPDSAGEGMASTKLLGTLFHQLFARLVSTDPRVNLEAALEDADHDRQQWAAAITEFAYVSFLSQALADARSSLHGQGARVLSLWHGTQQLAEWLGELCGTIADQDEVTPGDAACRFVRDFVTAEERVECDIQRAGWSDAVRLVGAVDAVIRIPGRPVSCAVELKLGRGAPETDLAQACLYHRVLRTVEGNGSDGGRSLALVRFLPERDELLLEATILTEAQDALEDLAGRLAGVAGGAKTPAIDPVSAGETKPRSVTDPVAAEHREQAERIRALYREFGLSVELEDDPIVGPTFIRYQVRPGRRVTVRQLQQRSPELQLRLGLDVAPVVGTDRDAVTVDVRRPDRQTVYFSSIRDMLPAGAELTGSSSLPVGVSLSGELRLADLAEPQNCHLLVAGTTGSGKSEWLRSAIAGLLCRNTPETLRFVLIDPKRNAFLDLKGSAFLRRPLVFPDAEDVVEVLDSLVAEMEKRYRLMDGADSLADYIRATGQRVPRIVCICDEYADLISQDAAQRREIELRIKRLGFKARAAGVHLILATQDPRRDVVSGTIKANMPSRVALKTAEVVESRTILGQSGAEGLLGDGDLLFKDIGPPTRLQAPFVSKDLREQLFAPGVEQVL